MASEGLVERTKRYEVRYTRSLNTVDVRVRVRRDVDIGVPSLTATAGQVSTLNLTCRPHLKYTNCRPETSRAVVSSETHVQSRDLGDNECRKVRRYRDWL